MDIPFEPLLELAKRFKRGMKPKDSQDLEDILYEHGYRWEFQTPDEGILKHAVYPPIPFRNVEGRGNQRSRGSEMDLQLNALPGAVARDLHQHFVEGPKMRAEEKRRMARTQRAILSTQEDLRRLQQHREQLGM